MNTKVRELNKLHLPVVRINHDLDKYAEKVLFPQKLEEANRVLREVGLPVRKK
ncbi:MAG: hypothetical protein LBD21_04640 [Tannerellaceae bacterium]|jgi:hypothetical protein|nr:hypothetical protein [Tannerellaceae bacterium]